MDVCQHSPPVPPLCRGERKGWEGSQIQRSDQRDKGSCWLFEYQFDSCISWLSTDPSVCVYLFACAYREYSVCIQYFNPCINAKRAAERVARPLCHSMSQHVVYWSCCWSNNRASPSESQCASLAAAISALVPLLITSVDNLCTIS